MLFRYNIDTSVFFTHIYTFPLHTKYTIQLQRTRLLEHVIV